MTEAALVLSEQRSQSLGELVSRMKAEREEEKQQQIRLRKKQEEVGEASQVLAWSPDRTAVLDLLSVFFFFA